MNYPLELTTILTNYGHSWEELEEKGVIIIDTHSVRHTFRCSASGWEYDITLMNVVGFGFDKMEIPVRWSY